MNRFAMRVFFGIGAAAFLGAPPAMASEITILSRSMPETCEFVFRAESDIVLNYRDVDSSVTGVKWVVGLQDSYQSDARWIAAQTVELPLVDGDPLLRSTQLTLQSMSTNPRFLRRRMNFYFLVSKNGASSPVRDPENPDNFYSVDFGRDFGEACSPDGRSSTPFRERKLELIQAPGLGS